MIQSCVQNSEGLYEFINRHVMAALCGLLILLMNESQNDQIIELYRNVLTDGSVENVEEFLNKLSSNKKVQGNFDDLRAEGDAAHLLAIHGFRVKMRESPDLLVQYEDCSFFAEVKRFRRKEQDFIDEKNMMVAEDELVRIGDTTETEGSLPWQQLINVIMKKVAGYHEAAQYILIIVNDSDNCVWSMDVTTALNQLMEIQAESESDFHTLSGILFIDCVYNFRERRQIYFLPGPDPLPEKVVAALNQITRVPS